MRKEENTKVLNKEMLNVILTLAWPTMLEQLMQTMVQYIDTAMVGTLGTSATAAVGATSTVNWLVNSTISALSIGFLAYIARACGAKDYKNAKKAVVQAVLTVLVVGTVFTVLTMGLSSKIPVWMHVDASIQKLAGTYFLILYAPMLFRTASIIFGNVLRAAGDTKTPMKIGLVVNIINIIFNFLLIYPTREIRIGEKSFVLFGAGFGVLGAAAASALALSIGGILNVIMVYRHPVLSPKGEKLKLHWDVLHPCLQIAVPNMLQRFGTSLGYVFFASMINSVGEVATAAHTIANTVESLFYIPAYGMQTAASTLAGNAYGASDNKKMKELAGMFLPIEVALMFVTGGTLFVVAPAFMGLFSKNQEVITLGAVVLRMVAVSEPFYGFSVIVEGLMQGVGKTKAPFVYNIVTMWGIRIAGTYLCTQIASYGLVAAWGCMILHNLSLFVFFLITYLKGSWNPLQGGNGCE